MRNIKQQRGSYIVEFAISATVFMYLLFAAVEVGRLMYTWSALNLATQRGARVAAVCPLYDEKINQIAIFETGDGTGSTIIPGVNTSHISVQYLDEGGAQTDEYLDISYVTVSIANYTHNLLIPLFLPEAATNNILSPSFTTTLPVESLGYDPSSESRTCFI